MPQLSHSPFPEKRSKKNRAWPLSLEADALPPEPRTAKGKLARNAKGREGNRAGRRAQDEGANSRSSLDGSFGPRGGFGNQERARGKNRGKGMKRAAKR